VLDGAVAVFCAKGGVEPQSETVWKQANKYQVPRIAYINKMDITGADYYHVVDMINDRLSANAVPVQLPIGKEADFKGIIDLIRMKAEVYYDDEGKDIREEEIPESLREVSEEYRTLLLDAVVGSDEGLMEKYFAGEEITEEDLNTAIRKATVAGDMTPVLCGTSYRNKGVQPLLDAICAYMPSPLDIPSIKGTDPKTGEVVERHPNDEEPFSALAFKIAVDPFVGKLAFFRVYSGSVSANSYTFNSSKGKRERFSRILRMHSNHREDVDTVYTGDIAAAVGLKETVTGDTLCDDKAPIVLEKVEFPDPVIRVAIEPKTKAGQEKLSYALTRLAEEDPTFKTYADTETGQTIIAGMGELHLEIIVDRMMREFRVEATVGKPQVAYRETIRKPARGEGRHVKQTGGHGQYGHAVIEIMPAEPGEGYSFESRIVGGIIPREFIAPIDAGIREAAQAGILAGYEVVDFKVALIDGSYHDVDSSEMAFKVAGSLAFKDAMKKADSALLEPMMKVEVIVPDQYMGDVIGDLSSRRGRIETYEARMGDQVIHSYVPLSEMFGYATNLRSRTQGRGMFTMEFDHYEEVPKNIAEKIIGH